jgi:hypothetical protein
VIEFLIELVGEALFYGFGEALVEGVARAVGAPFGRSDRQHPLLAGLGLALMGAAAGGLSRVIWPYPVLGNGPFPGISLIVSPLANGLAWEAIGRWQQGRGRPRSYLATFWGAGLFALSAAAVRFWLVGGR